MSGGYSSPKGYHFSAEEALRAVERCGSVAGAARIIGVSRDLLKNYFARFGYFPQVQEARRRFRARIEGDTSQGESRFDEDYLKNLPEKEAAGAPDPSTKEGRAVIKSGAELAHLRKENKRLTSLLVNQEDLFDRMVDAAKEPLPAPNFEIRRAQGGRLRDAILPLFDMQYGQRVRRSDTPGGVNEFNVEVFEKRADRYLNAVINQIEDYASVHTIENLWIVLGGDMVEGDEIFAGQAWQLELDPVEQVLKLCNLLEEMFHEIIGLSREELGVDKVCILGIPGNHGKVGGKRGGARPNTYNWDRLLLKMLEKAFKNYPIDIFGIQEAGYLHFASQDHTFAVIHGNEIMGWGGLPFYGMTKGDAKAIRLSNIVYDYMLLGHHHQPASVPVSYGEWLMSGNWVGANNLTQQIMASNVPSQWLLFNSKEHGVGDRSLIYLEDKKEYRKATHIYTP